MSYIEFRYDDNHLIARLNNDELHKTVRSYRNIKKLISICNNFGYQINGECIIKDYSKHIINSYERWYNSKKKTSFQVIGDIKPKMSLKRKNIAFRKRLTAASIVALMAICGATTTSSRTDGYNIPTTQQETTTEKQTEKVQKETTTRKVKETHNEIDKMLDNKAFHFSYEDRSNNSNIMKAKKYEHKFEKYAKRYGLDKNLLMAIAAQESAGDHYNNLNNGPAEGMMQIEKAVHIGEKVSAYNYETKQNEFVAVSRYNIQDLDTNIRIGAMILRNCMDNTNCNIPLALQEYNFGPGNINKVLHTCSELENIPLKTLEENPNNTAWLKYRSHLNTGDKEYVEHVFSYIENNTDIKVLDKNGNEVSMTINNDKKNSKHL